ncbi:hypothetical protein CDAR_84411 [Caerostris darwini]|uniref:Uncharacterized protein n=1 Tax=Caerostris darwini TaxID=1538125 RepID=A0AAV4T6L3_9ARAC|nr:hypothetical protein CDAR_84411 [Caerostris darwini]
MQNTPLNEIFSGNQGVNLLNQISTNTNTNVNVYSSNSSHFNQSSALPSASHANQTRRFHRKPNPGSHSQFPLKKFESPAEIRVFNSCQKSNVQNHTFKELPTSGQGQTPLIFTKHVIRENSFRTTNSYAFAANLEFW